MPVQPTACVGGQPEFKTGVVLMDVQPIQAWINALGRGYGELIAKGIIPNQALVKPFEESNWPSLHPAAGIELVFEGDTERFEHIMITLIQTVGQPVYTGPLPAPFTLKMDQPSVRHALGTPTESKPAIKLPGGLGKRGGADIYYLDQGTYPGVKAMLGYLENLTVNTINFSLIKPYHNLLIVPTLPR